MYKIKLAAFSLLCSFFSFLQVYGQFEENYTPMDSFDLEKEVLIEAIESNVKDLKKTLPKSIRTEMLAAYERKSQTLISLIESNYFLNDKELSGLIQEVYNEITTKNPGNGYPVRLLVSRSPTPNAQCWGEGTMVIHLGLLNRVQTHGELAFVMAHEMAHQLLDHSNLRLQNALERYNSKDLKKQVEESGKLNVLKNLTYESYRFSRDNEKQADSLAVILLKNTKYNWRAYETVLMMLDSAEYPKNLKNPSVKSSFNFSRFPFNDSWLTPPRSAFGQRDANSSIFNRDSVQSHPDAELRIQYLNSLFTGHTDKNIAGREFPEELQQRIDLEISQSTFILEGYAQSMFYSLQLLERYPENKFLKTLIAKIWVNLYMARKEHTFSRYVAISNYYPYKMEELYVFLNNLRLSEIGNIAFNYLNRDEVFDKENEEHYHMLWQICNELKLEDIQEKVFLAYTNKFPHGDKLKSAEGK